MNDEAHASASLIRSLKPAGQEVGELGCTEQYSPSLHQEEGSKIWDKTAEFSHGPDGRGSSVPEEWTELAFCVSSNLQNVRGECSK
jgi:hypothetical protein